MKKTTLWLTTACIVLMILAVPALAGDPNGAETYKEGGAETAVNFTWTLIAGFLVFFMQAGFALLEAGLTRAKNTANIMMKNLTDFCAGSLSYWAVGFALMFGADAMGLLGTDGFFLSGDYYDVGQIELWFFQMVFAATAATIVSGAMAERTKFSAYVIYSIVISAIIYPIYGHWLWGGGWLNASDFMTQLGGGYGALDFAGSGVVHGIGGYVALAGALLLGPRIGKYNEDGTPNAIPGHSISLAILGVFILFFGWFGFNPGSTLAATELRISVVATNTALAGAAGAFIAMLITWVKLGKPDVSMSGNGAVSGLVAITAPCAWVNPTAAVIIGAIAGVIAVFGVWFIESTLKVDDPVGAITCHALNGTWGLLALGIFADGTYGVYTTEGPLVTGLLYGNSGFFIAQVISAIVNMAWGFGMGFILFYILKSTIGIRVTPEEEIDGLDIGEHGTNAYPDFMASGPRDGAVR